MTPPTTTVCAAPQLDERLDRHEESTRAPVDRPVAFFAEDAHLCERLVVAPRAGRFTPSPSAPACDADLVEGAPIGSIADVEVPSRFTGTFAGWLAHPGEQVRAGQPLAWLRVAP